MSTDPRFPSPNAASAVLRAGRTKRARTRAQLEQAFVDLLAVRDYDEIRISDLASEAGVGQATVYNAFGNKAGIVVGLFTTLTDPIESATATAAAECSQMPPNKHAEGVLGVLRNHLLKLSALTAIPKNRRLVRAFLRAYAEECFALVRPNPDIASRLGTAQVLLNQAISLDPVRYDRLNIAGLGEQWTVGALAAGLAQSPEMVQRAGAGLVDLYLDDLSS